MASAIDDNLDPKAPAEVKDYGVKWVEFLEGDTINGSSWVIESGITLDSDIFDDTKTTGFFSGGTASNSYECVNTITTVGGRTAQQTIRIRVQDL